MEPRKLLIVSSSLEIITGVTLIFIPALTIELLFGFDAMETEINLGRITGLALLCFGFSCFPWKAEAESKRLLYLAAIMFMFNLLISVYLYYLRYDEGLSGSMLLSAAILHSVITLLYAQALLKFK